MKEFTVGMALMDFLPVLFFAIGAVIYQRDLYNKMSKGAFALFAAGTIDVIFAGSLKALYKLLYALGVCDFEVLSTMMFPLQSIGFMLTGIAVIAMLCHKQSENTTTVLSAAVAPAVWKGTFLFVGIMVAGIACMDFGFAKLAVRLGKKKTVILIVISFVCCLCMGYLSSKSFDKAFMNWLAESINIVGQGSFLLAAISLHKAGLGK